MTLLLIFLILWGVVEGVLYLRRWWENLVWFRQLPDDGEARPYDDNLSDCAANIAFYLRRDEIIRSVFPRAK